MKKAIVISLVALLLNSASLFVFAQTDPRAAAKDFTAAYDVQIRKTIATFPDLPGIAIVLATLDAVGADRLVVSDSGLREGILAAAADAAP